MAPSSAEDGAPPPVGSYRLPEHARIARLLRLAKAGFLLESKCWFGGGTAIVMTHGEYRMSLDVDFLCSSQDGYRALRQAVTAPGSAGLFEGSVRQLRDFRCDQYGLRAALEFEGQPIKLEIVREGRIDVTGALDRRLGCPVLSLDDQFAEKMMANSDGGKDPSVCYRDAFDLGMLVVGHGGGIPEKAWEKAQGAYGGDIRRDARWWSTTSRSAPPSSNGPPRRYGWTSGWRGRPSALSPAPAGARVLRRPASAARSLRTPVSINDAPCRGSAPPEPFSSGPSP